jgi:O-antigen ligase
MGLGMELQPRLFLRRPDLWIALSLVLLCGLAGSTVATAPLLAVAALPALFLATYALRRPVVALAIFLAQVPFSSPLLDSFFPTRLQGGRGFLLLLLLSLIHAWTFRSTAHRRFTRMDGLAAAFLLITFCSLFRSVLGFGESFDLYFASTLVPMLIYFSTRAINLRGRDVDDLLDALAWSAVVIALFLCVERVTQVNVFNPDGALAGWNDYATMATYRVAGPFVNPNNAGAFIVIGMALLARHTGGSHRIWVWSALLVMALAVFFTISRAAYLAIAAVLVLAQLHQGRMSRFLLFGVIGATACAAFLPFVLVRETVVEGVMNSSSMVYRLTLVDTAWKMLSSGGWELVFGFGYENFRYLASQFSPESFAAVPAVRGAGMPVHNDYLAVLIHYGAIGFVVFISLIWRVFRRAWDLRRRSLAHGVSAGADRAVALASIVLVQLVMSTSHVPFATYQLATLFWFAAAILAHQDEAFGVEGDRGQERIPGGGPARPGAYRRLPRLQRQTGLPL